MADWNPLHTPIDKAQINGITTPGICTFDSEGYRNEIENKRVNGSFGQFTEVKGREIPTYQLTFTLLTDDDWRVWGELKRLLDVLKRAKQAKAYSVVHPQVQELGIVSSTYVGRTHVEDVGKGKWQVTTYWQQWARLRPVRSRLDGANSQARQGVVDDEQDTKIRELIAQGDELAGN